MTYLESVTQAYERGYKIGKVHGRAENIETEETLRARVAELEAKLEAVKTAATKGGLSSHQGDRYVEPLPQGTQVASDAALQRK